VILTRSSEIHRFFKIWGMKARLSPGVEIPARASQAYWNRELDKAGRGPIREAVGEPGREVYGEEGKFTKCGKG